MIRSVILSLKSSLGRGLGEDMVYDRYEARDRD